MLLLCFTSKVKVKSLSQPTRQEIPPWNFPGRNTGVVAISSPGDLPDPGIEPRSPALRVDALPSEW